MPARDARIDEYIAKAQPFARPILKHIRKAVHAGCPDVEETLKWGHPAFMYKGILCGMASFKAHVTFGFWRASAMSDAGRSGDAWGQFGRITETGDLPDEQALLGLVKAAAALHDAGVKAPRMKTAARKKPLKEPSYLLAALQKNKKALRAYAAFPPSHKREYVEWITDAKGEDTRQRRLEAALGWIAEGKPRNWKYMSR
jgi:hypothetical protein